MFKEKPKKKVVSEEVKQRLREYMLSQYANGIKRGFQIGNTVWLGKKLSPETKDKIRNGRMGDKNWMWKGGVTPINRSIRKSAKWREWRTAVFERDNHTCQICGKRGGEMHPDHIKRFSLFPDLRFELSNGRTLCRDCHIKTPTYGNTKHDKS